MNRHQPPELRSFIELRLSNCYSEYEMNMCCIQFLRSRTPKDPEALVEYTIDLICLIFEWGFYPTELIRFSSGSKMKAFFEEIKDQYLTEKLVKVLLKLILDQYDCPENEVYFRFLGFQRMQNLKDKAILNQAMELCLSYLGVRVALDKLIYIVLIKFSLKISDAMKEFKSKIAQMIIPLVFQMFLKLSVPGFHEVLEFSRIYLFHLKLFVILGKEVFNPIQKSEETEDKMDTANDPSLGPFSDLKEVLKVFSKILIMNLQLDHKSTLQSKTVNLHFSSHNDNYRDILSDQTFKAVMKMNPFPKYSDYNNIHYSSTFNNGYEDSLYIREYQNETEIVEKTKINSLKLFMVIVRKHPEIFLESDMKRIIYPSKFDQFDAKTLFLSPAFLPLSIFHNENREKLKENVKTPDLELKLLTKRTLRNLKESPSYLYHKKKEMLKLFTETYSDSSCLITSLLKEKKVEIKSTLIEAINIYLESVSKKIQQKEIPNWEESKIEAFSIKLKENGIKFLCLYLLELYSCDQLVSHFVLIGIVSCPIESMLINIPNKLVNKIIDNLIIPVLLGDFSHEFLAEFDKVMVPFFESGFQEYFEGKIVMIIDILNRLISSHGRIDFLDNEKSGKLKIVFTLIDNLISYYPVQFIKIIPNLTDVLCNSILKGTRYSPLHLHVPKYLSRLIQMLHEISYDRNGDKIMRSNSVGDLKQEVSTPRRKFSFTLQKTEINTLTCKNKAIRGVISEEIIHLCANMLHLSGNLKFKDAYETAFIDSFVMIDRHQLANIDHELSSRFNSSIEKCLQKILQSMTSKKCHLQLIEFCLSKPNLRMKRLKETLWDSLVGMFKEKVLSVEIVLTNFSIINGLKDVSGAEREIYAKKVFFHTVGSLKSRNRKLVNNCIKTFTCLLTHYRLSVFESNDELEIPSFFQEEIKENTRDYSRMKCFDFLTSFYKRYLIHRYFKFNIISLNGLVSILNRHLGKSAPLSNLLTTFVLSFTGLVSNRLFETDCLGFVQCGIHLLSSRGALEKLDLSVILKLLRFCSKIIKGINTQFDMTINNQGIWFIVQDLAVGFVVVIENHASGVFKKTEDWNQVMIELFQMIHPLAEKFKNLRKSLNAELVLKTIVRLKKQASRLTYESEIKISIKDMTALDKVYLLFKQMVSSAQPPQEIEHLAPSLKENNISPEQKSS